MPDYVEPYSVACIQNRPRIVADLEQKDEVIASNLKRILELIDYATDWGKGNTRLVVCPEYAINGPMRPIPTDVETLIKTSVTIPSKWTDLLAEKARQRNVYITANMLEVHPDWPERFFNTTFIVSPEGEVILKHWKNNHNASHNPYTTPADIYSEMVKKYGRQSLFPVVDTPLGKIGTITCCECFFPELVRCTVLNGAEVIAQPTASQLAPHTKNMQPLIQGHCLTSSIYWIRANHGGFVDSVVPESHYVGQSMIIDYEGNLINMAPASGEAVVRARIDLNASRAYRENWLTWGTLRADMIGREYQAAPGGWPIDAYLDQPIKSLAETKALRRKLIEEMYEKGVLTPPFKPAKVAAGRDGSS